MRENASAQSIRSYKTLFQKAPVPMYIVNHHGLILDYNDKFLTFFSSQDTDTLTLTHQSAIFDWPNLRFLHGINETNFFEIFPEAKAIELEVMQGARQKSWVLFEYICFNDPIQVQDNNVKAMVDTQYLCSLTGIGQTKQKQLEQYFLIEKLKQSNFQLEHLAHIASHDLQAPLNKCCHYLYLLEETLGNQEGRRFLEKAIDMCFDMKQLITQVLSGAKTQHFEDHTLISLNTPVQSAILILEDIILSSEANLQVEELPNVLGSCGELTRVFQNLISNSIKYRSHLKPSIVISQKLSTKYVEVIVRDNGLGVCEHSLSKIFEYTAQEDQNALGYGIGLTICKTLMEKHQGSIEAHNNQEGGMRFILRFPRQ